MERATVSGVGAFVTVKEAARMLGITISGVHKALRRNNVPVVKLGNAVLIRASDLRLIAH